jgi:hypothetical protein
VRVAVRAWTVVAAVGLAGAPIVAADPPPGPHILTGKTVEPDDIRMVAEFLAGTDGSPPKGSIVDEALDLMRRNPGVNYKELAAELARRHQELATPDKLDALIDQFQGLQRAAGPLGKMLPEPPAEAIPGTRPDAGRTAPFQGPTLGLPPIPGGAKQPAAAPANPPKTPAAPAGGPKTTALPAGPKTPSQPQGGPSGKPPLKANPVPTPGARGEPGPRRPRGPEMAWEPPSFLEAVPAEGTDLWQAREQRAKAEAEGRAKRQRQFDAVRGLWESNVGDLDDTPAVREMLREMLSGPNPIAPDAAEGLLALLGDQTADARGFAKWAADQGDLFEDVARANPFGRRLGGLNLSGFDAGPAGGPLAYQPGAMSGEGSWLSVVLFAVVAGGALVVWRFWPRGEAAAAGPQPLPGLGPWPVDPRLVADRADLIRAFEYLSVLVVGAGARAAHHLAIADALRTATGSGDAAEPLARGYALARYTPAADPLPPGTIAEARGHLCRLAGVAAP